MGYGGDLIWSGVFRALHSHDGRPVVVANAPKLSDLMVGCLHDRAASFSDRVIFAENPHITFLPTTQKGSLSQFIDTIFSAFLKFSSLRRLYERWIIRLVGKKVTQHSSRIVHVDMLVHSYAERETKTRFVWKKGGHAIATILNGFGLGASELRPELFLNASEQHHAAELLADAEIVGPYITLEPDSNREWFGELRAWPHERWVELIAILRESLPDIALVQVGLRESPPIPSTVDLRGKTTFREAAALIQHSQLFIGTEGGLMHAARAVNARALILWGGVTLPEFAGYPDSHKIICHRVACAPCGQLGWCNNGHECMRSISVEEVTKVALACVRASNGGNGFPQ